MYLSFFVIATWSLVAASHAFEKRDDICPSAVPRLSTARPMSRTVAGSTVRFEGPGVTATLTDSGAGQDPPAVLIIEKPNPPCKIIGITKHAGAVEPNKADYDFSLADDGCKVMFFASKSADFVRAWWFPC